MHTVLDEYEASNLVVVARVDSINYIYHNTTNNMQAASGVESIRTVIDKVYKGDAEIGEELLLDQGGSGDCIYHFREEDIGHKYLFYLKKPPNDNSRYLFNICGRSQRIEYAADDLLYLENLDTVRGRTRISGTLRISGGEDLGVDGIKVRILQKEKVWEIKTNKDGVYEIYDLPAGEYLIEPKVPYGWKIDDYYIRMYGASFSGNRNRAIDDHIKRIPIILQENKNAGLDILFDIDNAIRGQIVSLTGEPLEGVCLKVDRVNRDKAVFRIDCTDINGEFKIDKIPPGKYFLATMDHLKNGEKGSLKHLYYPGVTDKKSATVFTMDAGTYINDINMQIPINADKSEISGSVFYHDGKLVNNGIVVLSFKPDIKQGLAVGKRAGQLIENGKFRLEILKDSEGTLSALMFISSGMYNNCPAIEKILSESGKQRMGMQTNEVRISGKANLSNIQLFFPFPYCERAKDMQK